MNYSNLRLLLQYGIQNFFVHIGLTLHKAGASLTLLKYTVRHLRRHTGIIGSQRSRLQILINVLSRIQALP
jgi:hypothetical protein